MITVGVDFHKRTSSYHVLDETGELLKRAKFENSRESIRNFLESIPGPKCLAMEATRSWGLLHDCVKDLVDEFHLGHPKKMKAVTESQTKNDKKDAEIIARLDASGFFPKAHVSSSDARQLRSLIRFGNFCVNERRSLRNQVHALIDRNLWASEKPKNFKSLFCHRGLGWLSELSLPPRERFILNQCIARFHELTRTITEFELFIQSEGMDLPGLVWLRTVPGFRLSKVNALSVLVEADGIERFPKARSFAHYSGLIPSEDSSGDHQRMGRLVKDANMHLRTAFIESALAAIRCEKGLKAYYKQVKERRGSGAGIIAVARKLSYAVYHVLKEQRAYRPEPLTPAAACHP